MAGGARMEIKDPRVSSFIGWGAGLLGIAVIAIGTWVASSINELTIAVAKGTERLEFIAQQQSANEIRIDRHDARLNQLERDVSAIGGTAYRGGEFTPPKQR